MDESRLEELIEKALSENDYDSLQELVSYYESIGDNENALRYKELLEFSTPDEHETTSSEEIADSSENDIKNATIAELREMMEENEDDYRPYLVLADKYVDKDDIGTKVEMYDKAIDILKRTGENNDKLIDLIYETDELKCDAYEKSYSDWEQDKKDAEKVLLLKSRIEYAQTLKELDKNGYWAYDFLSTAYKWGWANIPKDENKSNEYLEIALKNDSIGLFGLVKKKQLENKKIDAKDIVQQMLLHPTTNYSSQAKKFIELKAAFLNVHPENKTPTECFDEWLETAPVDTIKYLFRLYKPIEKRIGCVGETEYTDSLLISEFDSLFDNNFNPKYSILPTIKEKHQEKYEQLVESATSNSFEDIYIKNVDNLIDKNADEEEIIDTYFNNIFPIYLDAVQNGMTAAMTVVLPELVYYKSLKIKQLDDNVINLDNKYRVLNDCYKVMPLLQDGELKTNLEEFYKSFQGEYLKLAEDVKAGKKIPKKKPKSLSSKIKDFFNN